MEGGSANDYDYVSGDPINGLDLAGTCEAKKGNWFSRPVCNARNVTGGAVRNTGLAARWTYRHGEVSFGGCVLVCLGLGFQGGSAYFQYGGGCCYAGGNAGFARQQYRDRACNSYQASAGVGLGVYGSSGTYGGGRPSSSDISGGVSVSAGFGGGRVRNIDAQGGPS